jgi:hypothetical protein
MDPRRKQEEKDKGLSDTSQEFWNFKEKVLEYERELLRTLAFNLAIDHPYKYMLQSVKSGKEVSLPLKCALIHNF